MTTKKISASHGENYFGMSDEAFSVTSTKNDLEKWKLMNQMYRLQVDEKLSRVMTVKKLQQLQDEITKMIAEGCVYKTHSFGKYDPFNINKSENETDRSSENCSPNSRKSTTLPSISDGRGELVKSPVKTQNKRSLQRSQNSFPSINDSPGNEKSIDSYDSDEENENKDDKSNLNFMSLSLSLHGMVMWRQKLRDKECEKPESRKSMACRQKSIMAHPNPKQFKEMFPGNCKTYYSMKKFVAKEAENMINHVDSPMYTKKRMKLNRMIEQARIPQFVRRDKTTSAILRDFREFKHGENGRDKKVSNT